MLTSGLPIKGKPFLLLHLQSGKENVIMETKIITNPFTLRVLEMGETLNAYTPDEGEPIVVKDGSWLNVHIGDGVSAGGIAMSAMGASASGGVATPSIISPNENETLGDSFIITSTDFVGMDSGRNADSHASTYWQVATDPNFESLIVDREGDTDNLTLLDLEAIAVTAPVGQLYIRCAYLGAAGIMSYWSAVRVVNVV